MSKIARTVMLLFLVAIAGFACDQTQRFDNLYNTPIAQRREVFQHLSASEQIDAYLYGMENLRPPPSYLSSQITNRAAETVTAVTEKLRSESDDFRVMVLIDLFSEMQYTKKLDVKNNTELMTLIRAKHEGIKKPERKADTAKSILVIEGKAIPDYARPVTEIMKFSIEKGKGKY